MSFSKVSVSKVTYQLNGKNWQYVNTDVFTYTPEQYNTFISSDTIEWFKRLGSKQVIYKAYTEFGKLVHKLESFAPDHSEKIVYSFVFIN